MTEFEQKLDTLIMMLADPNITINPSGMQKIKQNLLAAAKKQLEADPEFLYTATRKAADKARKETINEICKWVNRNFNMPDDFESHLRKYMKEQHD